MLDGDFLRTERGFFEQEIQFYRYTKLRGTTEGLYTIFENGTISNKKRRFIIANNAGYSSKTSTSSRNLFPHTALVIDRIKTQKPYAMPEHVHAILRFLVIWSKTWCNEFEGKESCAVLLETSGGPESVWKDVWEALQNCFGPSKVGFWTHCMMSTKFETTPVLGTARICVQVCKPMRAIENTADESQASNGSTKGNGGS